MISVTEHPQVALTHPYGHTVEVDELLAPLLAEMWKRDISTTLSCQNNTPHYLHGRGVVWIMFLTPLDLEDFLDIVAPTYSTDLDSLYQRVRATYDVPNRWIYDISVDDLAPDHRIEGDEWIEIPPEDGKTGFSLDVSVRFSPEDLPLVEEAFGISDKVDDPI